MKFAKCIVLVTLISGLGMAAASAADQTAGSSVKAYTLDHCFMSGHGFDEEAVEFDYQGRHIKLCCKDCKAEFDKEPAKFLTKLVVAEKEAAQGYKDIDVAAFEKMRADRKAVVLDVRTKREYNAGHIPGAVNLDVNSSDFAEKVAKLDKSKTYLVHCQSGHRSVAACKKLAPRDFEHIFNFKDGYQGWVKAGHKPEK